MKIMFDDLTKDAQMRLLDEVGVDDPEEMGWDIKPVAVISFEDEDEDDEDEDHWDYEDEDEDYVDYGYDDEDEE